MSKLGTVSNVWTTQEIQVLKEKYPLYGSNIPELLARHPKGAVLSKAYILHLKYDRKQAFKSGIGCKWTPALLELLKEKYPQQGTDIPELLEHFTPSAIRYKAYSLRIGLSERNKFTEQEIQLLVNEYPKQGAHIPELLERHDIGSIRVRAHRMGLRVVERGNIARLSAYTEQELQLLTKEYSVHGPVTPELLKRHTLQSLYDKASRMGLHKNTRNKYTEQEILILKQKYQKCGPDIPELLMRHTKLSIYQKASKMNLHFNMTD